ncbi:MAG: DUF2079 domain-containing protein, partial [Candidatus Omnitrophota bacterium]
MLIAQYLKYLSLRFYVDFSHWTVLLNSIITTGKPFNFNHELIFPGTNNYLSVHFVPFIYLIALPFKLWPYSETVIILNFIIMISSIVPLYKLSLLYEKSKKFGLFMMALLVWYPTFQYTVLYEFEMLRFAIPIIFWMFYFLEKRSMKLYYLFVFLAVLVREEVGLTIMMFGIYLFFFEKKRKAGMITSIIGICAFIAIAGMLMPKLSGSLNYEHIAAKFFTSSANNEHFRLIHNIFNPIKMGNIVLFFLPFLFIPFFAPALLISSLANFGIGILSQSPTHISFMLYYLSPSLPVFFFAFIKGWPKFIKFLKRPFKREVYDFESSAMAAVLCALFVSNVFFGPSPASLQFWFKDIKPAPFRTQNFHYSAYLPHRHDKMVESFVEMIPDDAIVSAEHFLHPRLLKKRGAMVFPQLVSTDGKFKADYVFIDKSNPIKTGGGIAESWDGLRLNPQFYYDLIEKKPEVWKLLKTEDGYYLF